MLISKLNIYGIDESILASGYPMSASLKSSLSESDMKRAVNLGNVPQSTGHDCYLKGIVVQMDITAPQHVWLQILRYHFLDVVSSQSKMHKLLSLDINSSGKIDSVILNRFYELIELYKVGEMSFDDLMYNCPCGVELTARVTTNYLQLKTIYHQRHKHKLQWWRRFCKEVELFPLFTKIAINEVYNVKTTN